MSIRVCIFFFVLGTALGSCRRESDSPIDPDYDYIPLETGLYSVYEVQEIQYERNNSPIQRTYQLKEAIGPAYTDVTGQTAYRLLRYRRISDDQPWQTDSIWSVRLVNNEVIRTENGQDCVKLVYPLSNGLTWNGNRYNMLGPDEYETRNVGQPFSVLGIVTPTVTIVAQNDSTLIGQSKRVDVYAHKIGMIYKERTYLQFCTENQNCLGKNQIEYGIWQIYRIQTYGKE